MERVKLKQIFLALVQFSTLEDLERLVCIWMKHAIQQHTSSTTLNANIEIFPHIFVFIPCCWSETQNQHENLLNTILPFIKPAYRHKQSAEKEDWGIRIIKINQFIESSQLFYFPHDWSSIIKIKAIFIRSLKFVFLWWNAFKKENW